MRLILSHSSLALRDRMGAEGQPKRIKIRFRPGVKRVPEKDRATYVCNLCHKKISNLLAVIFLLLTWFLAF